MTEKFTPGPLRKETVSTQVGICHKIGPLPSCSDLEKNACIYVDIYMHERGRNEDGDELERYANLFRASSEMYALLEWIAEEAEIVDYDGALCNIRPAITEWAAIRAKINEVKP